MITLDNKTETLCNRVQAGERRALAKAITLIESTKPQDQVQAQALLAALPPPTNASLRLGLSGTPGVGKSTFIEALGLHLTSQDHRVAVLAVDPSSARTGGAILGDKTRMERLARDPNAFIRPSPAQNHLGGVARRTADVIQLVEAAGFDIVLVETVGVGQSETMVAQMIDIFILLLAPAGGDELQGVKRGIMEIADLILVNKADGALTAQARATCADYSSALHLMRPRPEDPAGYPMALTVSALTGRGLAEAWEAVQTLAQARRTSGSLSRRRITQRRDQFHAQVDQLLRTRLMADPALKALRQSLENQLAADEITPTQAAEALVSQILPH